MDMDKDAEKPLEIPLLGLGTWRLFGEECERAVHMALDLGYRHIDTADVYQNHEAIGRAIKPYPRKELFLVSKLFLEDLLPERVKTAVPRFLDELGIDYLDGLLIHWPNPDVRLEETLAAMVDCQKGGLVRWIGVSNFVRSHLEALVPYHFPIAVNQIEMHPFFQRKALVALCRELGIAVTAYRPLAKGAVEEDPTLKRIGRRHGKKASQVALRWLVQQKISAIPKASSFQHLKDNISIFDFNLDEREMEEIGQLDAGKRFCAPEGMPIYED